METVNFKIDIAIETHDSVKEHPFVNISLDGVPVWGAFCKESQLVEFDADIEDGEHILCVEYQNKDPKTDVIIENGEIVGDKRVEIANIMFDDIDISDMAYNNHELMIYRHNTNGHSDLVECAFDPSLGFNGEVELKFHTPIYLWLLENM